MVDADRQQHLPSLGWQVSSTPLSLRTFVRALVILALLLVGTVAAQPSAEVIADDPVGDVVVFGSTHPSAPAHDLRSLAARAEADAVVFILGVDNLQERIPGRDSANYLVYFDYQAQPHRLVIQHTVTVAGESELAGRIQAWEQSAARFTDLAELQVAMHDGDILSWVPSALVASGAGLELLPGQPIEQVLVVATSGFEQPPSGRNDPANIFDRMPDVGSAIWRTPPSPNDGAAFTMHVVDPVRLANGGEVQYAFPVELVSTAGGPLTIELNARGPDGWNVLVVDPVVQLTADEILRTHVVVQGAGAHQHGELVAFSIEAVASDSTVQHGAAHIQFTHPPQPAGHHDTLYWHTGQNDLGPIQDAWVVDDRALPFLSTLEEDPGDFHLNAQARGTTQSGRGWIAQLWPNLAIGLDMDMNATGEAQLRVSSHRGTQLTGVELSGLFQVIGNGTRPVAEFYVALDRLSGPLDVAVPIVPLPGGDLVPFDRNQQLRLVLDATFDEPVQGSSPENIQIHPGGWFRLPLNEYRDPLGVTKGAAMVLDVSDVQDVAMEGWSPIAVRIQNQVDTTALASVDVIGLPEGWSVRPAAIEVEPAGFAEAMVWIDVPSGVGDGDVYSAFVVARQDGSASVVAPLQVRTTVALAEQMPPNEQTPGVGVLALPAIAFLVASRRRLS